MSKWRPSSSCLYTVPDLHGNVSLLKMLLTRILPLRSTGGSFDKLIFLGDYTDRHRDGPETVDLVLAIKNRHPDQVITLKGNHDQFITDILLGNEKEALRALKNWRIPENGGLATLTSYLQRAKSPVPAEEASLGHIREIIPPEHQGFFINLSLYHQEPGYRFVHAGCHPTFPLEEQLEDLLLWDRNLFNQMKKRVPHSVVAADWQDTVICGHNGPTPIFQTKYMMLDAGSPKRLLAVELHSRQAYLAEYNNERLVRFEIQLQDAIQQTTTH